MKPSLTLIAAVARNGVIGRHGDLPWRLPADLKHFRALTLGHRVLMGRHTWESLGRPLSGRDNVVITSNAARLSLPAAEALAPGTSVRAAASLSAAIDLPAAANAPDIATSPIFVIGGGALYTHALPLADELQLTEIDAEIEGDVCFPRWRREDFEEIARCPGPPDEALRYSFVHYRRCRSA
ncbi:MAG: dihydrofolate reductase [Casimicrobiaceae bacterium]